MYEFYHGRGWVEVICGGMFCGKTEELLRRLRRFKIAGKKFQVFKPEIDARYDRDYVVSHNQDKIEAILVNSTQDIRNKLDEEAEVVAIDEAQFFDADIVTLCEDLAKKGKRVIAVGLDQDYLGKPFDPMPALMAIAEHIVKLHAICKKCGHTASKSKRIGGGKERVEVAHSDIYEARCRHCFDLE